LQVITIIRLCIVGVQKSNNKTHLLGLLVIIIKASELLGRLWVLLVLRVNRIGNASLHEIGRGHRVRAREYRE
jgi:hypothetical protein